MDKTWEQPLRDYTCADCGIEFTQKAGRRPTDGKRRCPKCLRSRENRLDKLKGYNLTEEDFKKMWDTQNGLCAICKRYLEEGKTCIDHDHVTTKVRGLLCHRCNLMLGHVADSLTITRAAVSYLMRFDERRSWDHYFLDIAEVVATRSKDHSNQVGAVLVRDRQILASGYNGFPTGVNDAIPERHLRPAKYLWTVHAEENALLQAGRHGISTEGATLYVTPLSPCVNCAKAAVQAGVKEIVCFNPGAKGLADKTDPAEELLEAARVLLRKPD